MTFGVLEPALEDQGGLELRDPEIPLSQPPGVLRLRRAPP